MKHPAAAVTRKLIEGLMDSMEKKGFFFVGLVGYKEAATDAEAVKIGTTTDFMKDPKMKPIVIRMLRNTAYLLEQGKVVDTIEIKGNW